MKIAQVSPYDLNYPGGVVSHIFQLGKYLNKRGHEVKYLGPSSNLENWDSNKMISIGKPVSVQAAGSIARISLEFWKNQQIKKILHEENFDVIHLHEPLMPSIPLRILSHSRSINIGTFHAYNTSNYKYYLTKWYLSKFANKLDGKIAVSLSAKEYVDKHFPGNYRIIPNGIDLNFLSQKSKLLTQFNDDKFNILFLGRLEKRKGLKYLLEAYIQLKKTYAIRLIIIGPGKPDRNSMKLIKSIESEDIILTGGIIDEFEKRMYFQTSDLFCAPNTGNESFGIVLAEAMASGLPVVASDITGFRNVIDHGENGFLFKPNSVSSIYHFIELLILNKDLRNRISQNGLNTVQKFDWNILVDKILNCYDEAKYGL
jgi:phosphatidylinositol alpha-mannosyltransferase